MLRGLGAITPGDQEMVLMVEGGQREAVGREGGRRTARVQ